MSTRIVHASQFRQHPFWFRMLNGVWGSLKSRQAIDGDRLIKRAKKKTRLSDFGEDNWSEPFFTLIDSINKEANLHPIGVFITKERLVNILCNRLLAEYWFQKQPEILEQETYPVWLIAGLQRTGTTKLQRLLDKDPDNRVLKSWEALNPSPTFSKSNPRDRVKKARLAEKSLQLMSPGYFAIHPVEHLEPEEDVLLLDLTFSSTTAEATMHVPSYADYIEKNNQQYAYDYLAKTLKLLQWQHPGKRWVLKSPHHLEFLKEARSAFKDLTVLWPHRQIDECLPSFLSMVAYSRSLFSDEVHVEEVTNHWKRKTIRMLEKGIDYRKDNEDLFLDIQFNELVNGAIYKLQRIYQKGGVTLGADQLAIFRKVESKNVREKYGRHAYQAEDFGLNKEIIDLEYGFYYEYFSK